MFHNEDAETEMLAKHVKHVVHRILEPNVDEDIFALEVMGISVDKESVA